MKQAKDLMPSRKARTQQAELIHKQLLANSDNSKPKKSTMSRLEQLPNEIIHQIFFQCLNINLPRASRELAKSLSKQDIYRALVLLAYYEPQSGLSHHEIQHFEPHHFSPAKYRRIVTDERIRLQSDITRCRWFTFDLFESCMPVLSRLKMVECWCVEEQISETMQRRTPADKKAWPYPGYDKPKLDDLPAMESHYLATIRSYLPHTASGTAPELPRPLMAAAYMPFINGKNTLIVHMTFGDIVFSPTRPVITVRVLPNHILQGGPWTDSKVKILQLLRQGLQYGTDSQGLTVSLDASFTGMANAISEGNEKALLVLVELHNLLLKRPARNPDAIKYDTYPPPNVLPLRLFHLACRGTVSPATPLARSNMISLLLRGGVEDISSDDVVMTRWATRVRASKASSEEEVRMARWLLRHMEQQWPATEDRHLLSSYHEYRPHDGRSFAKEIGYHFSGTEDRKFTLYSPHSPDDV